MSMTQITHEKGRHLMVSHASHYQLIRADLIETNMSHVTLNDADLHGANLIRADLIKCFAS